MHDTVKVLIYILIAIVVTNGIRILPITLIRKPIKNKFIQSFLYYYIIEKGSDAPISDSE